MARKNSASKVDTTSSTPLYLQVQATLKEMIDDLEFSPGEQIPSERDLSEKLGVSRMTVRHAIESLTQLGILERRSTNGTYVRQPEVVRQVGGAQPVGISQLLQEEGAVPGSRLLSFESVRAPRKVAESLNIRVGEMVVVIRRLRLANGQPFCVETSYLPQALVPGLAAADLQDGASLYDLLRQRFGIMPSQHEDLLNVSYATPDESVLLKVDSGSPIMLFRSVVSDSNGQVIEYLKSVNHPERVAFRTIRKVLEGGLKN